MTLILFSFRDLACFVVFRESVSVDVSVSYEDAGSSSGGNKVCSTLTLGGVRGGLPWCLFVLGEGGALGIDRRGLGALFCLRRKLNFFIVINFLLTSFVLRWSVLRAV